MSPHRLRCQALRSLCWNPKERRSVPQFSSRIRTRDRVSCESSLRKAQAADADASNQTVYVPAPPLSCLHSLCWNLPSRYQAAKPSSKSSDGRAKALRLWLGENLGSRGAERQLHLLALLPCTRIDFWSHELHYKYRCVLYFEEVELFCVLTWGRRHLVDWLCNGRVDARSTAFPW